MIRVFACGGTAYMFDYRHAKEDFMCPWCGDHRFTVVHLVRDCVKWAPHRQVVRERVKEIAAAKGMMKEDQPTDSDAVDHNVVLADQWYRLTMGATTTYTFFRTALFGPVTKPATSKNGRRNTATTVVRQQRPVYHRVLNITGAFLQQIVVATQQHLGVHRTLMARESVD